MKDPTVKIHREGRAIEFAVLVLLLVAFAPGFGAGEPRGPLSWEERLVLDVLTPERLEEFLAGMPAEEIVLDDGTTLALHLRQGPPEFELTWSTIDGGGAAMAALTGDLELTGTSGQPDAAFSENADFELLGGFWAGSAATFLFRNGFESGDVSAWSSSKPASSALSDP